MLTASVPIISLFVLTGSTYTFTTLASRLSGGDHIDEKQVAPSMSQVGSLITAASMTGFNRTTGSTKTGADQQVPTLSYKNMLNHQMQVDHKEAVQAAKSLQDAITNGLSTSSQYSLVGDATASYMNDTSSSTSAGRSFIESKADMLSSTYNISKEKAMKVAAAASLGIKFPSKVIKAEIGVSMETAQKIASSMSDIQSEAKSQNLSDSLSIGLGEKAAAALGGKNSEGHSYMEGASNVDAITEAASHVKSTAESYSESYNKAENLSFDSTVRLDSIARSLSSEDKNKMGEIRRNFDENDRKAYKRYFEYFSGFKNSEEATLMAISLAAYNSQNNNVNDMGNEILEKYFPPTPTNFSQDVNDNIDPVSNKYFSDKESGIGKIGDLNERESDILANAIKMRESSGRYNLTNDRGYLGAYQFGAERLQDLGYIKKGVNVKNKSVRDILSNANNWTGLNGIYSQEDFLANKAEQDRAFERHINGLWKQNKDKHPNASKAELAGWVMASHLLGFDGANSNLNKVDGNDVTGTEYFNIGKGVIEKAGNPDIDKQGNNLYKESENRKVEVDNIINKGKEEARKPTPVSDDLEKIHDDNIANVKSFGDENERNLNVATALRAMLPKDASAAKVKSIDDYNKSVGEYKRNLKDRERDLIVAFNSYPSFLKKPGAYTGLNLSESEVNDVVKTFRENNFNMGEVELAKEVHTQLGEGKSWNEIKVSDTYKTMFNNLSSNMNAKLNEINYNVSGEEGANYAKYIEQTIENSSLGDLNKNQMVNPTVIFKDIGGKSLEQDLKDFTKTSEYFKNISNIKNFYIKSFTK